MSTLRRTACIYVVLTAVLTGVAQTTNTQNLSIVSATESAHLQETPTNIFRGLNAGITFSGVHDSGIGWYTVMTPAISYTFSRHYSVDASASLYPSRLAPNSDSSSTSNKLIATHWDAGDTWLSAHAVFTPRRFQNTTTAALVLPSGNAPDSLSTGRVTFDFSNHTERYIGNLGTIVDIGGGDSSALFNRLVVKDNTSLGALAHFQTGLILWLPGRSYIQSLAYEQLPIGDQKIYRNIPPHGGLPPMRIVSGHNVYEDNGFTTSAGIPLTEHVILSTYYNRSLRLHLDTVSAGLTFIWKGTPIKRKLSIYDKALLQGEQLLNQ